MKRLLLLVPLAAAFVPWALGQAPAAALSYGPSGDTLIARPGDDGVLAGFRRVYRQSGAPRFVVCVNRALVGAAEEAKPGSPAQFAAAEPTVAEIERMFGRAFREAGARMAEPRPAISRATAESGARLIDDAAAADRKALAEVADIAIEVLISRRPVNAAEVSGEGASPVPDIHATAIRLKDVAIIGRASAGELLRKGAEAGRVIGPFNLRDIAVATAIALMEDMLPAKP